MKYVNEPRIRVSLAIGLLCTTMGFAWYIVLKYAENLLTVGAAATVNSVLASTAFLVLKLRFQRDFWFHPGTWFCAAWSIIFVGRPWSDAISGDLSYHQGLFIGATYAQALYLGAVGLVAFLIPVLLARLPAISQSFIGYSRMNDPDAQVLNRRVLVLTAVVMALYSTFIAQVGGLSSFLIFFEGRSQTTADALRNSSGYLYTAPLWLAGPGIYMYVRGTVVTSKRMKYGGLLIAALSQTIAIVSGNRSFFVPVLLSFLIARWLLKNSGPKLRYTLPLIPLFVGLVIILPQEYRSNTDDRGSLSDAAATATDDPLATVWQGDDTAMARNLALQIAGTSNVLDYGFGDSYLSIVTRPIPRQFFGDVPKPRSGDEIINEAIIVNQTGLQTGYSYSIVSEPLYNFGLMGVILQLSLMGFVSSQCYCWYKRQQGSVRSLAVYAASLPMLAVFVRGGISVDFERLLFTVVPLLLISSKYRGYSGPFFRDRAPSLEMR